METRPKPSGAAGGESGIAAFWNKLKPWMKIAIIGGAVALIAVIILVAAMPKEKEYELLYTGLSAEEAAQVYTKLQDLGADFKLEGTDTVYVAQGTRSQLRLQLLNEGFPSTGFDYTIWENATGLGSTDMDKRVYEQFQKETNLAYMIKRLDKVKNATVMLTLAETSQFVLSNNAQQAQASVVIEMTEGNSLSAAEANTIRQIVMNAVPQLTEENITIADTNLNIYRAASGDGDVYAGDRLELTEKTQSLIKDQVYNLLAPVFGPANLTTAVHVVLDFDKSATQTVTYTPPGNAENMGIIISLRQTAESVSAEDTAQGTVGFDSNGAAPFYPSDMTDEGSGYYQYTQELNAELNEVRQQIENAQGDITDLRVSIMVDADEAWDDQLDDVRALVANAVGVDEKYITIMRTSFLVNEEMDRILEAQRVADEEAAAAAAADTSEADANRLTIILIAGGALLAFAVVVIILVSNSKKRKKQYEDELKRLEDEHAAALAEKEEKEREIIEDTQSLVEQLGEDKGVLGEILQLVNTNPAAVAQLLRNWLTDDYGR